MNEAPTTASEAAATGNAGQEPALAEDRSAPPAGEAPPLLAVHELEMRFGTKLIQRNVSLTVERGSIFAIIGGSGCGKSTLLRHIVGLLRPASGRIEYSGVDYWAADQDTRERLRRQLGMLFQSAALWSGMSLIENVCLPLELHTELDAGARKARAQEVLAWVGLEKFGSYFPADLSGGMKKRAGLARAIVAEAPLLLLDEPTSGLDPISSRRLDDLILDVRERTGAAVIVVTHDLPSLLAIADDSIFLDADSKEPIAHGNPRELRETATHPTVHAFLHREVPAENRTPAAAATTT